MLTSDVLRTILISLLNWDCSAENVACVTCLLALDNPVGHRTDVIVIGGGSSNAK